jgi:hypothetical protein
MKNINHHNRPPLARPVIALLIGGLVVSVSSTDQAFGDNTASVSDFTAKVLSEQHDHSGHHGSLQSHYAGHHLADLRHLRHIGSGGHKLTPNDLKHNAWNYYLAA